MKSFKSRKEMEDLKSEFIEGGDESRSPSEWSFSDLKRLNENQLADRLESINNQSLVMTWVICMHIRARFRNDREMGQFINTIRDGDPDHPLCVGQQSINRYIHAGRFITRHKINNLSQMGVSASAVYALSAPANLSVADEVFREVKRKGYPVNEVKRRIEQAKAVHTLEAPQREFPPLQIAYDRRPTGSRVIQVENGQALEDLESPVEDEILTYEQEDMFPEEGSQEPAAPTSWVDEVVPQDNPACAQAYPERLSYGIDRDLTGNLSEVDDADLILELASRDASGLSDDQAITDLLLFAERYKRSYMKLIPLFMSAAQALKTQHLQR